MREEIKSFARSGDTAPVFAVDLVGRSYCDGSYHIRRPDSPVTVIEYVEEGTGIVSENGRTYTASAGCIYLLHAGRDHDYYSDAKHPWVKKWCNMTGSLPMQLLDSYGLGNTVVIPDCGPEIGAKFDRMLDVCWNGGFTEEIFDACALWFHGLVQQLARRGLTTVRRDTEIAQAARRLIEASIESELSVDQLCAEIGVSRSKLFQCFGDTYGEAPYAYYQTARLASIKLLLKNSFLSIAEISEQYHFADAHYFSGWFKKHTGLSPLLYRKAKMGREICRKWIAFPCQTRYNEISLEKELFICRILRIFM